MTLFAQPVSRWTKLRSFESLCGLICETLAWRGGNRTHAANVLGSAFTCTNTWA
jgi:hypothetical protein